MHIRFHPAILAALLFSLPAAASPLVAGNGLGFAVVSPTGGELTKFYAHPYSFVRPDPRDELSEGIGTTNFVKSVKWEDERAGPPSVKYVADSDVIRVATADGEGFFFMPFGLRQTTLVFGWKAVGPQRGRWRAEWALPITSTKTKRVLGITVRLVRFEGAEETLVLVPLGRNATRVKSEANLSDSPSWALISLDGTDRLTSTVRDFERWRRGLSVPALAAREIADLEHWRAPPPALDEKELHLWRQSEVILRMAQSREPNRPGRYNNGLIVACLPDGSWFMPWARDMAYATAALIRMGHRDEARAALLAYFNARPTGKMKQTTAGADYQVSVARYFGNGAEEPFFTQEGSTNVELDDWGLVLWLLGEYMQRYDDPGLLEEPTYRGTLYESARDYVVKPLLANLERNGDGLIVAADTSIWEERQKDKKHFAFTTAAAIAGLRNFAVVAHRAGDEATRTNVLEKVALLEKGFSSAFVRGGTLHGTLEEGIKNDIDGALLAAIDLGVVVDPAILRSTADRMELLKVASGGYRRVRGIYTDPTIYEYWYEKQEFLFVDFTLSGLYRWLGRIGEADAILSRIVDKAATNHNFIPEMFVAEDCKLFHGALGDPTGAIPMVGYGAGVYILQVLERARQPHPN